MGTNKNGPIFSDYHSKYLFMVVKNLQQKNVRNKTQKTFYKKKGLGFYMLAFLCLFHCSLFIIHLKENLVKLFYGLQT